MLEPDHFQELTSNEMRNNIRNHGSYRLLLKRPSRSPAFSRSYMPGDPVNLIDWKLFARTDHILVREEHDESAARVLVLIDLSHTMDWPAKGSGLPEIPTKLEIAMRAAFNIAYIHMRMTDLVRVAVWQESDDEPVARLPFSSPSDIVTMFHGQLRKGPNCSHLSTECVDSNIARERYDRIFWVSDALCNPRLDWLANRKAKIHFFHCLSSLEVDADWVDSEVSYFDESRHRKEYLGTAIKSSQQYTKSIQRWRNRLKKELEAEGHIYQLITDQTAIYEFHHELILAEKLSGGNF